MIDGTQCESDERAEDIRCDVDGIGIAAIWEDELERFGA